MRLGNYRWFLFFALVGFSLNSFAVEYYWNLSPGTVSFNDPDPEQACIKAAPTIKSASGIQRPYTTYVTFSSATQGLCGLTFTPAWSGTVGYTMYRVGTECIAPKKWDDTKHMCVQPPGCGDKVGTSKPFSKSGTAPDGYLKLVSGTGKPLAVAQTAGCFDGCMASTADQKCTAKTTGAYFCRGTAYFDGQSCDTAGTPGVDQSSSAEYPQTAQTNETKPCTYVTNADGTQSCTSSKGTETDGQICGTVSATGEKVCVDKAPSKNGISVATTVRSETDADGNKTTTKTDTATTTKCSDIKVCTSTSTTVTTVIKSDSNGKTVSATGSCTGANCPDKNTNPDGDGDGFGDCVTGDCGEGEGEGGGGQDWYQAGDDTYKSVMQDFAENASHVPVVTSVKGFLDFAPAGACPRYSVQAWVFTIQLDQWCTTTIPWSLIAAVVIGTAAFIAFRIAFT